MITIVDNAARFRFVATAAQTVFTVPAEFFLNADLKVYLNGTLKTITTHYTVTGALVQGGGTVTFLTGCALNDDVLIVIDLAVERTSNFPVSGVFDIDALNLQLNRLTKISQRLETDLFRRSLHLSIVDTPETLSDLPVKATRASKLLGFDSTGQPSVVTSFPTFLSGAGVPGAGVGSIYDMYIDTATGNLYGPKTASGWGAIVMSILGPPGAPGAGTGDVVGPASATDNRVALFNGGTGKLIKQSSLLISELATLASPALTGNPTAPTPSPGDNDTSISTTAFVTDAIATAISNIRNGVAAAFDTLAEIATELALKATIASPTFTGTPAAPTAAPGTNTTQISTTAFVLAELAAVSNPWTSIFKTADEDRISTTVLAADATLQFTATAAGIYIIKGELWAESTSNTPDFKFSVTGPVATGVYTNIYGSDDLNIDWQQRVEAITASATYIASTSPTSAGTPSRFYVQFRIRIVVGGSGGTIAVNFAQASSSATATKMKAGSNIEYRKVA